MMLEYVTVGDQMLDEICYRHYGSEVGTVEWVLGLNPHLAHLPLILPEGTVLFLPEKREDSTKKEIKLWD